MPNPGRRSHATFRLNTPQDAFMAARIGDQEWLQQVISFNKNYLNLEDEKVTLLPSKMDIESLSYFADLQHVFVD